MSSCPTWDRGALLRYISKAGWVPFSANISNIHLLSLQAVLRAESRTTQLSICSTVELKVTKIQSQFFKPRLYRQKSEPNMKIIWVSLQTVYYFSNCKQYVLRSESWTTQFSTVVVHTEKSEFKNKDSFLFRTQQNP